MATSVHIRWAKAALLPADDPVLAVAAALDHDFSRTWASLAQAELALASGGEQDLLGIAALIDEPARSQLVLVVWSIGVEIRDHAVSAALLAAIEKRAQTLGYRRISATLFAGSPTTDRAFSQAGYRLREKLGDGRSRWERELT